MDLKSSVNTQASLRNWCQVTLCPSLQRSQLFSLPTQTERGPCSQTQSSSAASVVETSKAPQSPSWPLLPHRIPGSLVPGIFPTASELHPSPLSPYLTCLVWASLPLSPLPSSEFWNLPLLSDPSLGFWALRQHWLHN